MRSSRRKRGKVARPPWASIGMRIEREGERIVSAYLYPVRSPRAEQVLLPRDEATLVTLGRIAAGESRARLYVTDSAHDAGWLELCLRGTAGAVAVTGGIAAYADPLVGKVRQAMTRTAARHQAAGDTDEAQRWKQMARAVARAKRAADQQHRRSVRTVSGGLPTLGRRR
ncbi:hypothetical protein ACFYWP_39915 [Actinacidiphila glaucinigra]|uniref:hypothetical protein n=1 Tax=Actinacidiphila glaucinigra TaxID=235986 RepID=UPI0036D0C09B